MEGKQKLISQTEALKAKIRRAGASFDSSINQPFALVSNNPFESLGVALALGLLVGKFPNTTYKMLELFVNRQLKG
jgi:ElaB/YqjD/DUF883 family membrane-anchored ribosome-binding protein